MVPEIPCELHELICSYLDLPTLKIYSLTCCQFHAIAQKLLFAGITLKYPRHRGLKSDDRARHILHLAGASSSIRAAVRTVVLVAIGNQRPTSSVVNDPILCSLLSHLQNVKNFGMKNVSSHPLSWTDIEMTVRQKFIGIFHSDALTNLALRHIVDLPLGIIDGCPALEEISLDRVSFQAEEMDLVSSGSPRSITRRERRTELKSLRVAFSDPMFHFFSTWITSSTCNLDVTHLQRFSAEGTTDFNSVNRILEASAATLEIFCIHPIFEHYDPTNPDASLLTDIVIRKLSSLCILRMRLGKILPGPFPEFNLPTLRYSTWLFSSTAQLWGLTSIAEISIYAEQAPLVQTWHLVDAIFASCLPPLRRFTFIAPEDEFHSQHEIKLAFPKLESRNMLDVQMSKPSSGFLCVRENEGILARAKVC